MNHDWDTLFRRLGWAGSYNPTRTTASLWKQWEQQHQGTCRVTKRGHSASNPACNVGIFGGGVADDTWSIDSINFSSLYMMSVQSRSRQRRSTGGAVKHSDPVELDALCAPPAPATPHRGPQHNGPCKWQDSRLPRHDGRRGDGGVQEFPRVLLGSQLDLSASQSTYVNTATGENASSATFVPLMNVQRSQESESMEPPAFGAAVPMRSIPAWDQAALAAYPRTHGVQ